MLFEERIFDVKVEFFVVIFDWMKIIVVEKM